MKNASLFLAFKIIPQVEADLKEINPHLLSIFTSEESGDYLQRFVWKNDHFFGKQVESPSDLVKLEQLETHIHSILKRLLPHFSYEKHPLVLLSISH